MRKLSFRKPNLKKTKSKKLKWNRKRKIMCAGALILVTVTAAGTIFFRQKGDATANSQSTVSSAEVTTGSISTTITGTGTLASGETTDILVPTGIVIDEILVSSGDEVKKGDKLATVNEASVASVILEIQEKLDDVEDAIDDLSDDADTEGTTEYYQAKVLESQKEDLEEVLTTLETMLSTKAITATSDGTISSVSVSAGNEVGSGSTSNVSSSSSTSGLTATNTVATVTSATLVKLSSTSDSSSESQTITESSSEEETTESTEETSSQDEESTTQTEETTESEITTESETTTESQESTTSNSTTTKSNNSSSNNSSSTNNNTNSSTSNSSNGSSNGQMPSGSTSGNSGVAAGNSGSVIASGSASGDTSSATTTTESSSTVDYSSYESVAFTLASNDTVVVSIDVDELDINSVSLGQSALVTLDALEGVELEGTITSISSTANQGSSSVKYPVEITIEKTDDMILGMSASATIYIEEAEDVLLIPVTALQEKGNKTFVYTEQDSDGNLSGEVEVETGLSNGTQVEITSGLSEGDTVYYSKSESSGSDSMDQMGGQGQGGPGGDMPSGGGEAPSGGGDAPSGGPGGSN